MRNKWVGTVGNIKAAGSAVENAKESDQQGEIAGFNPTILILRPENVLAA